MKKFVFILCILLAVVGNIFATDSDVEFDKKTKKIFLAQTFKIMNRKEAIPDKWLNFAFQCMPEHFYFAHFLFMANPDQPFEETDVVSDPRLPNTRLIFAGYNKNYFFVYCEQGGIGYNCELLLYKLLGKKKMKFLGRQITYEKIETIEAFKKFISDPKYKL